jgi:hypothetical protein
MIKIGFYGHYVILAAFFVISISTGLIFAKRKTIVQFLIFVGFCILFATGFLNTFFGYSATFDEQMNTIQKTKALLSIDLSSLLSVLGSLSVAIGLTIKAVAVLKEKPNNGMNADQ